MGLLGKGAILATVSYKAVFYQKPICNMFLLFRFVFLVNCSVAFHIKKNSLITDSFYRIC